MDQELRARGWEDDNLASLEPGQSQFLLAVAATRISLSQLPRYVLYTHKLEKLMITVVG